MNWFTWTPLELSANVFTAICIVLAGRNNVHTWWTGIVGCILYGVMFYNVQLYADTTLQIFFIATSIYGWVMWVSGFNDKDSIKTLPLSYATNTFLSIALGIAVIVAIGYGFILYKFTNAYAPWIDSAVLTLSVVAQLLLMRRNIQSWYLWIIVDTLSVPLFWSRELYLTSILYGAFWVNAIYSLRYWKQLYAEQLTTWKVA